MLLLTAMVMVPREGGGGGRGLLGLILLGVCRWPLSTPAPL